MMAGFDRYFQIAPCFRDEDARADRSPGEFYQLDIEMSFVTQEDVFQAVEPVLARRVRGVRRGQARSTRAFPRIPYADAMLKYGTDKPDLRNPLVIADVTEEFARGRRVQGVQGRDQDRRRGAGDPGAGRGGQPRSFFDKLNDWAPSEGAPGLGYIVFERRGRQLTGKGPIAKFIPAERQAASPRTAGRQGRRRRVLRRRRPRRRPRSFAGKARTGSATS